MATEVYSVRIVEMREVSPKAVSLTAFDGSSDIFPKSAIYGHDDEVGKCEAVWVAAWILPKKALQYSTKKMRMADDLTGKVYAPRPTIEREYHNAPEVAPVESHEIESLRKPR